MTVELTREQLDLLMRLVDAENGDVGPEIHHTRTYQDPLKEQRRQLQQLYDTLAAATGHPADKTPAPA
jgi:hypothetical protein